VIVLVCVTPVLDCNAHRKLAVSRTFTFHVTELLPSFAGEDRLLQCPSHAFEPAGSCNVKRWPATGSLTRPCTVKDFARHEGAARE